MNDRELLELAAKAAGIELDWDVPPKSPPWRITGIGEDRGPAAQWNPLTDDGDALRLAVKLGFTVKIAISAPIKNVACFKDSGGAIVLERISECEYTATRRAIVLAAAEIGKTM